MTLPLPVAMRDTEPHTFKLGRPLRLLPVQPTWDAGGYPTEHNTPVSDWSAARIQKSVRQVFVPDGQSVDRVERYRAKHLHAEVPFDELVKQLVPGGEQAMKRQGLRFGKAGGQELRTDRELHPVRQGEQEPPQHAHHSFRGAGCAFLGRMGTYDLYFVPHDRMPFVVARWGSGLDDYRTSLGVPCPELDTAKSTARALGYPV
jgi:hypothetical protein